MSKRRPRIIDDEPTRPALEYHPIADAFPLMEGAEFDELAGDIEANGLREPIVLLDGKILDGRNRYRASIKAKIDPATVPFEGDDPIAYVISKNLRRRHLDTNTRAMIAAKLATMRKGERTDIAPRGAMSDAEAAKALHVSERSVERAKAVARSGVRELVDMLEHSEIGLANAAQIAKLPTDEQHKAITELTKPKPKTEYEFTKPEPRKRAKPEGEPEPEAKAKEEDRVQAFLSRAKESVLNASADDLAGIEITEDVIKAAEAVIDAWTDMRSRLRGGRGMSALDQGRIGWIVGQC